MDFSRNAVAYKRHDDAHLLSSSAFLTDLAIHYTINSTSTQRNDGALGRNDGIATLLTLDRSSCLHVYEYGVQYTVRFFFKCVVASLCAVLS